MRLYKTYKVNPAGRLLAHANANSYFHWLVPRLVKCGGIAPRSVYHPYHLRIKYGCRPFGNGPILHNSYSYGGIHVPYPKMSPPMGDRPGQGYDVYARYLYLLVYQLPFRAGCVPVGKQRVLPWSAVVYYAQKKEKAKALPKLLTLRQKPAKPSPLLKMQ